jgi:hypothetical protein
MGVDFLDPHGDTARAWLERVAGDPTTGPEGVSTFEELCARYRHTSTRAFPLKLIFHIIRCLRDCKNTEREAFRRALLNFVANSKREPISKRTVGSRTAGAAIAGRQAGR